MKIVQAIRTADGVLHERPKDAERHAKRRYDDAMTAIRLALLAKIKDALTCAVTGHGEAFAAAAWIEENFDAIAEAAALRADTIVENEDDFE